MSAVTALVQWLDRVGPEVFWACAVVLIAVDVSAAAAVIGSQSRALVNRWTTPVLVVNALLLGAGVGVPTMMYVTKVAVMAVAPAARARVAPLATATEP